jgi:hypothetical protein
MQHLSGSAVEVNHSNLFFALRCANAGLHVLPCCPTGQPIMTSVRAAKTDANDIKGWWRVFPDSLVGVACAASGLLVADGDVFMAPGIEDAGDAHYFIATEDLLDRFKAETLPYAPEWALQRTPKPVERPPRKPSQDEDVPPSGAPADESFGYWHGETGNKIERRWTVYRLIPEVGAGLLSGQWGMYKTFIGLDLSAALMTGTPFCGSEIDRPGGTMFYAAEGEYEVHIRFQAAVKKRHAEAVKQGRNPCFAPDRAPFFWATPEKIGLNLLDPASVDQFIVRAKQVSARMVEKFGLPLSLIEIDTLIATAGYKKSGDSNDDVTGVAIMDALHRIGREVGAAVAAVDHFGKAAETGTRGTISKEDNSDFVLAALGDRTTAGIVTNPRLAARKVKGGKAGIEYKYNMRVVDADELDDKGRPQTTLVIDWDQEGATASAEAKTGNPWNSKALKPLRRCLDHAVLEDVQPDAETTVRAAKADDVKAEFLRTYVSTGETPERRRHAAGEAWRRSLKAAADAGLIIVREIGDVQYVWIKDPSPTA